MPDSEKTLWVVFASHAMAGITSRFPMSTDASCYTTIAGQAARLADAAMAEAKARFDFEPKAECGLKEIPEKPKEGDQKDKQPAATQGQQGGGRR